MTREVYCVETQDDERVLQKKAAYPYPQPFMPPDFVNKRDPINKNVEAIQFYYPKRVETFEDQMDKYLITLVWGSFPPFNLIIPLAFLFDLTYYIYDLGLNFTVNTKDQAN